MKYNSESRSRREESFGLMADGEVGGRTRSCCRALGIWTLPRNTTRNLLRDRNVLGRWYLSVGNGTLTKLRLGSREFVVKSRSERGAQAEFCRVPLWFDYVLFFFIARPARPTWKRDEEAVCWKLFDTQNYKWRFKISIRVWKRNRELCNTARRSVYIVRYTIYLRKVV